MEEKTRKLLTENSIILKGLSRLRPYEKPPEAHTENRAILPDDKDQVDRFLQDEFTVNPSHLDMAKNKTHDLLRVNKFNLNLMSDFKELHSDIIALRDTPQLAKIKEKTLKIFTKILPSGVLFSIKGDQIEGLGAFGNLGSLNSLINAVRIPLKEQSIVHDVVVTGELYFGPLMPNLWNNFLSNRFMKGVVCPRVMAIPVFSQRGVGAVILSCDLPEEFPEYKHWICEIILEQFRQICKNKALEHLMSQERILTE